MSEHRPDRTPHRPASGPGIHQAAIERLGSLPRTRLAHLPTPLVAAKRLAASTGAGPIYVKMDAETGFALGGNKVRKLELELAPPRLEGVTHLVTAGGHQSNHCRVTAAFAARHGLGCVLVANGPAPTDPTGNPKLHRLFGARIETVPNREARVEGMVRVAEEIDRAGGTALVVPIGASTPLGSLGYALAAVELTSPLDALDDDRVETVLFVSASSCGTLAGLLLGLALLGRSGVRVFGVSADASRQDIRTTTERLVAGGAGLLGTRLVCPPFEVVDDQVGGGYGIPTPSSTAALERFGREEGIVLDPTYTAKAAAGMIAWLRKNGLDESQRLVFIHTGGAPGLLA